MQNPWFYVIHSESRMELGNPEWLCTYCHWCMINDSSNVGKTIINHPLVITMNNNFIGAINHSQMGGLFLFYSHYIVSQPKWEINDTVEKPNRKPSPSPAPGNRELSDRILLALTFSFSGIIIMICPSWNDSLHIYNII